MYCKDTWWEKLIAPSKPDKLHKNDIDTSALPANIVVVVSEGVNCWPEISPST